MNHLNSIILEGNVVKQPELREPVEGFKVCTICVAVHRFYKSKNGESKEEVSFIEVETVNSMAEYAAQKCEKGRGIRVVGRLKQEKWEDSEKKAHSKLVVVAEHIEYKPQFNKDKKENASEESMDAMKYAEEAAVEQEVYEAASAF